MGVSKAHAGEEEPRERLACVDGNPVDEIAVEEGDLLRGALAATVDAADLLCASCHPEEQPLGMAAGFTEATKDQALVMKHSLQSARGKTACKSTATAGQDSRGEAISLGPARATLEGGVGDVCVRSTLCGVPDDGPDVANDTLRAPRGAAVGVSKAHAGEEELRERLACVDGNPVDEIAVEEGDLLRGALAATVDAADLLCASCHPEEQPLGMAAGFTEGRPLAAVGAEPRVWWNPRRPWKPR